MSFPLFEEEKIVKVSTAMAAFKSAKLRHKYQQGFRSRKIFGNTLKKEPPFKT